MSPPASTTVYGAGLYFNEAAGLVRTVTPGDLAPVPDSGGVPVADTIVPLNEFNPLLGMTDSGNSLVVEKSGTYELRYYVGVQLAPSAPFEVFVTQTTSAGTEIIAATVEDLPAGPILLPRLIAKTATVPLKAGASLNLVVRVESAGVLRVIPGALLSAQRVGA